MEGQKQKAKSYYEDLANAFKETGDNFLKMTPEKMAQMENSRVRDANGNVVNLVSANPNDAAIAMVESNILCKFVQTGQVIPA